MLFPDIDIDISCVHRSLGLPCKLDLIVCELVRVKVPSSSSYFKNSEKLHKFNLNSCKWVATYI